MLFYWDWPWRIFIGLFNSKVRVCKDLLYGWEVLGCFWGTRIGLRISIRIKDCIVRYHIQRIWNSAINWGNGKHITWLFRWVFRLNFLIKLSKQLWFFNGNYINSIDLLNLAFAYSYTFLTIILYNCWAYILLALLLLILQLLKSDLWIEVSAHLEL